MPVKLAPRFQRPGISTELWVDCVLNFRKSFRASDGRPKSIEAAAETPGHNRAISVNSARRAFTDNSVRVSFPKLPPLRKRRFRDGWPRIMPTHEESLAAAEREKSSILLLDRRNKKGPSFEGADRVPYSWISRPVSGVWRLHLSPVFSIFD
jgi:hypothetical protein